MEQHGFIQDMLDVKVLILFVMSKLSYPVSLQKIYELCYQDESHFNGLLEYPQYTKPAEWHGVSVPEVLLSGHHKNIDSFRLEKSIEITRERRPDMYEKYINTHNIPGEK